MNEKQVVEVKRLSMEGNGFITEEGARILERLAGVQESPINRSVTHSISTGSKRKARPRQAIFVGLNKEEE